MPPFLENNHKIKEIKMIKYKYLRAWDMMMHSSQGWMDQRQIIAESENAPLNAIYRETTGVWHTFDEIVSDDTKKIVQDIVNQINKGRC